MWCAPGAVHARPMSSTRNFPIDSAIFLRISDLAWNDDHSSLEGFWLVLNLLGMRKSIKCSGLRVSNTADPRGKTGR
jgi:hypothetical protein